MKIEKKKKKGILYARIPEDLVAWLKLEAYRTNHSLSEYVTIVLQKVKSNEK